MYAQQGNFIQKSNPLIVCSHCGCWLLPVGLAALLPACVHVCLLLDCGLDALLFAQLLNAVVDLLLCWA
jgi:hypothetical protein